MHQKCVRKSTFASVHLLTSYQPAHFCRRVHRRPPRRGAGEERFPSINWSGISEPKHVLFYRSTRAELGDGGRQRKATLWIFKMSPLPNVMSNVTQWLRNHPVECIIWAGIIIRRGLDILLPLDAVEKRNELFSNYEDVPVDCGLRLQSALCGEAYISKARRVHGALRQ